MSSSNKFTVPIGGNYIVEASSGVTIENTSAGSVLTVNGTSPIWTDSIYVQPHPTVITRISYDNNLFWNGDTSYNTLDDLLAALKAQVMKDLNIVETKINEEVDEFIKD